MTIEPHCEPTAQSILLLQGNRGPIRLRRTVRAGGWTMRAWSIGFAAALCASVWTGDVRADDIDDARVARLQGIVSEAGQSAHDQRMVEGWMSFGLGATEAAAGGIVLGTLDDPVRVPLAADLFLIGGLSMIVSLPTLLIRSQMEHLALRFKAESVDVSVPASTRIATALSRLQTIADAERSRRILVLVAGSLSLTFATAGTIVALAINDFPDSLRAGFAGTFVGLAILDIAVMINGVRTGPAERALSEWSEGKPASASSFTIRPVLGPTGAGLVGTF